MKKKEYKKWVKEFGLSFFSWLTVLPCCAEDGQPITLTHPVPIVHFPIADQVEIVARIKTAGFHFASSTLHYVPGYHIPEDHTMLALVKDRKEST